MATPKKTEGTDFINRDGEEDNTAGLTDRQRTKLEKRDAGAVDTDEHDDDHCDNHPDRDSVVTTDGSLFAKQSYCAECAVKYGYPLPSPVE